MTNEAGLEFQNEEFTGTLSQWSLVDVAGQYTLFGTIIEDTKGRFKLGEHIRCSTLKSIDFEKGIAITHNSKYKLLG